jgi:hypothetical protein
LIVRVIVVAVGDTRVPMIVVPRTAAPCGLHLSYLLLGLFYPRS